jgi:hypothetical protein
MVIANACSYEVEIEIEIQVAMLHRDICFISQAGRPDMDPVLLLLEAFTILCFLALYYRRLQYKAGHSREM